MADLTRVNLELAQRITGMTREAALESLAVHIECGFRPLSDQWRLWDLHQADPAHNAVAAYPGTSNHGKVVNGVQIDATAVDLDCDNPTAANQTKHLALARRWGLRRTVVGEYWHLELDPKRGPMPDQPTPTPAEPQEVDGMADALVIEYPNGAKTIATPDGSIFNAGTPFFGSLYSLKPTERQGVVSIKALTPVNPQDAGAGYVCWSDKGNKYAFTPEFAKNHGV